MHIFSYIFRYTCIFYGKIEKYTVTYQRRCTGRRDGPCSEGFIIFRCFYPRDAMLARVIAIATCLSVRLSVTRRYCVKTKKASGMISSPSGSPKTLVFCCQISPQNSKGFPRTGPSKKGRSENFSDFLALSVNISKTVTDTAKVTISH